MEKLQAYLAIRTIIQENELTSQEAIDLITNSSNLKAFMALRKVIEEENLTPDETKTIIKKAIEDLNNGILQAEQPKIINNGEDR